MFTKTSSEQLVANDLQYEFELGSVGLYKCKKDSKKFPLIIKKYFYKNNGISTSTRVYIFYLQLQYSTFAKSILYREPTHK